MVVMILAFSLPLFIANLIDSGTSAAPGSGAITTSGAPAVTFTSGPGSTAGPVISGESVGTPTETSIPVTWTTDEPSTSRVLYDTVSHATIGSAPNYGYANSTTEDAALVTSHSVAVSGLVSGTPYFFRTVSHGSPESVGREFTVNITADTVAGRFIAGAQPLALSATCSPVLPSCISQLNTCITTIQSACAVDFSAPIASLCSSSAASLPSAATLGGAISSLVGSTPTAACTAALGSCQSQYNTCYDTVQPPACNLSSELIPAFQNWCAEQIGYAAQGTSWTGFTPGDLPGGVGTTCTGTINCTGTGSASITGTNATGTGTGSCTCADAVSAIVCAGSINCSGMISLAGSTSGTVAGACTCTGTDGVSLITCSGSGSSSCTVNGSTINCSTGAAAGTASPFGIFTGSGQGSFDGSCTKN